MRRIAGVLRHPRSTMAALVAAPSWFPTWVFILALWLVPAGWFLSTPTGRLALVDERVRQVEAFGGRMDDARYGALLRRPPREAYFLSGGRMLLSPPITILAAAAAMALARLEGAPLPIAGGLAVSVHASVPLAIQQLIAIPVSYLTESMASPTNLAAALRLETGTLGSRVFGAIDLFGLWWVWLLAVGLSAATGRRARGSLIWLVFIYAGIAAALAAAMTIAGGS
jgi:Yip1-like protein